jgi:hypothetical protein
MDVHVHGPTCSPQHGQTKKVAIGCRLVEYAHYVDTLGDRENGLGCAQCKANREILEHAWQVVANEYYDPYGHFTQADWAGKLQSTLEDYGGALQLFQLLQFTNT